LLQVGVQDEIMLHLHN